MKNVIQKVRFNAAKNGKWTVETEARSIKMLLRWLHTVSHQFQQTNIHNFFDDFQDTDLHFTREKLQKQLA